MSELRKGIEDIVYEWSMNAQSWDRLIDELEDFVVENYGPPF